MQDFFTMNIEESLKVFSSSKHGISQEEVKEKLFKLKDLQIKEGKRKNFFLKFLSQFSDLMVLILLVSSIISIIIGIVQGTGGEIVDGGIILGIVLINASMGVIQERKAEKSMEMLKQFSEPECVVIRDGIAIKDLTKNLVHGDIVVFEAGCIIPADCRLIESFNLFVNESSLTGESISVSKDSGYVMKKGCPLAERKNMVYKGTTISSGRGLGMVVAVGIETELGKIAKSVNETSKDLTPLQKGIKDVGKILTILILIMAGITFILEIIAKGNPMEAFLTAIAISVAAIPESMPAVITIIMSLGISRLAKQKAIIRRMHSVETLGCCDVICSDKTGTITQNKMVVKKVFCDGKILDKEKPNDIFLQAIILCNDTIKSKNGYVGDPTEIALSEYGNKFKLDKTKEENRCKRLDEIAFNSKRKLMSTLNDCGDKMVFVKGAVDVLIEKCSFVLENGKPMPINSSNKKIILQSNEQMSESALRVLGVAYKKSDKLDEENLIFLGLVGMIDPPRKETINAVRKCKKAGMRPIMITGDHAKTAFAIAKEVGIADNLIQVITGVELDKLSDEELLKKIENISVYARVSPENKARVVGLLKEKGHIVAMTGDGVNDAPSLKKASIGIGMGQSGTDIVKEVADMIIADDNFATIVIAVEEGRKVYKNIQKTVKYLFSANMGEILSLFLATILFPQFTFLLPAQILFVNLITDSLPAIALGVEKAESNIMEQNPRKEGESLFSNGHGKELIFMGIVQTIIILLAYIIGLDFGGEITGMTMAFYSLNMIQLFFLFSARTENSIFRSNPFKNKLFNISLIFGFGLLITIATTPLYKILGLTALSTRLWIIAILLSVTVVIVNEIYKMFRKKCKVK